MVDRPCRWFLRPPFNHRQGLSTTAEVSLHFYLLRSTIGRVYRPLPRFHFISTSSVQPSAGSIDHCRGFHFISTSSVQPSAGSIDHCRGFTSFLPPAVQPSAGSIDHCRGFTSFLPPPFNHRQGLSTTAEVSLHFYLLRSTIGRVYRPLPRFHYAIYSTYYGDNYTKNR